MKNQQLLNVVAQQAHDMEIVANVGGSLLAITGTDIRDGRLVLTTEARPAVEPVPAAERFVPKLTAKEKKAAAAAVTPPAPADSGEIE